TLATTTDGKLREPVLYITRLLRAYGMKSLGNGLPWYSQAMKEDVFDAPSVFNFYPPSYKPQGSTLYGPEFKILNSPSLVARMNFAYAFTNHGLPGKSQPDFTALVTAASDSNTLIASLDTTLLHGTMPSSLKSTLAS